jgi:hypothetical protein
LVKSQFDELGRSLTNEEVIVLLEESVPKDADILADGIIERMIKNDVLDPSDAETIRKAKASITNEPMVKTLVQKA